MSINVTLFAQIAVFVALIWFTMEYIWPILLKAMEEREGRIADGLAASEEGHRKLEQASEHSREMIEESQSKAADLIAQAQKRSDEIIDEARQAATEEGRRLLAAAQADAEREQAQAREALRAEVSKLAIVGAEQILRREVDLKEHSRLLTELGAELGR